MPNYLYICHACEKKATEEKGESLTHDEELEVIFETYYSINAPSDVVGEATICPRCDGRDTAQAFNHNSYSGYVRGDGYLDKAGVKRDMNVYTLQNDDPYASMREPGEVDHKIAQFKKAGTHAGKPKKHYDMSSRKMENIVEKVVKKKPKSDP
jgi:hypothetical protein